MPDSQVGAGAVAAQRGARAPAPPRPSWPWSSCRWSPRPPAEPPSSARRQPRDGVGLPCAAAACRAASCRRRGRSAATPQPPPGRPPPSAGKGSRERERALQELLVDLSEPLLQPVPRFGLASLVAGCRHHRGICCHARRRMRSAVSHHQAESLIGSLARMRGHAGAYPTTAVADRRPPINLTGCESSRDDLALRSGLLCSIARWGKPVLHGVGDTWGDRSMEEQRPHEAKDGLPGDRGHRPGTARGSSRRECASGTPTSRSWRS